MMSLFLWSSIFFHFKITMTLCFWHCATVELVFLAELQHGCICHFRHSIHLLRPPSLFTCPPCFQPSATNCTRASVPIDFPALHFPSLFSKNSFSFEVEKWEHRRWLSCTSALPIPSIVAHWSSERTCGHILTLVWLTESWQRWKFEMFWRCFAVSHMYRNSPIRVAERRHTGERHSNVKHWRGQKHMQRSPPTSSLTDSLLRCFAFLGSLRTSEAEASLNLLACESCRLAAAALVRMCTAGLQTHSHGPLENSNKKKPPKKNLPSEAQKGQNPPHPAFLHSCTAANTHAVFY